MRIEDIKENDVLVSTDEGGSGYYRVLKVSKRTVRVRSENGNEMRAYPHSFNRKVTYPVNV
jgi:hypothetical protein